MQPPLFAKNKNVCSRANERAAKCPKYRYCQNLVPELLTRRKKSIIIGIRKQESFLF